MAKVKLNAALTQLSGTLDKWVYRQTPDGTILSRQGRRKQPWSQEQKDQRLRMAREAAAFYHAEMHDAAKNVTYRARAKAEGIPVSAFVMGGYMKYGARFAELEAGGSPIGNELDGRDGSDHE